jgi:hypothetical protein
MRKRLIILAAIVAAAAIATTVGFAYFGGSASASASGTVIGHSPVGITLTGTVSSTPLYPGAAASVSLTVANSANKGSVHAGTISGDSPLITGFPVGCVHPEWFSFAPVVVNQTIANGSSVGPLSGSLSFIDDGTDQSCLSDAAGLVLHLVLA